MHTLACRNRQMTHSLTQMIDFILTNYAYKTVINHNGQLFLMLKSSSNWTTQASTNLFDIGIRDVQSSKLPDRKTSRPPPVHLNTVGILCFTITWLSSPSNSPWHHNKCLNVGLSSHKAVIKRDGRIIGRSCRAQHLKKHAVFIFSILL
jgi:hypothetical protein